MPRKPKVIKHLTKEELEEKYRKEKYSPIKERVLALLILYDGTNITEVSGIIKRTEGTIQECMKSRKERGYERILPV